MRMLLLLLQERRLEVKLLEVLQVATLLEALLMLVEMG